MSELAVIICDEANCIVQGAELGFESLIKKG